MLTLDPMIRLTDIAIFIATLSSPLIAVQVSEWLRKNASSREARERLFHILMSTRGARLHPDHVGALNRIDLLFPMPAFPGVSDAWTMYLAQLDTQHASTPEAFEAWSTVANGLFYGLLQAIASALKVPFTNTAMRHNAYYPQGFVFSEGLQNDLRAAALSVMKGETALKVRPATE